MKSDLLKSMLLIEEPSVLKLYQEMMQIAGYFIAPVFLIAILIEFFGDMNFGEIVKKLLVVTVFMTFFYQFHTTAVGIALESASDTLQKVSPRNIFAKKWYEVKVRTRDQKDWSLLEKFAIPNLNDLVGTAFFLLSKAFIWLLKLIYSTVYHFTYVFSGITAVMYFLGWTKDALKGTVQGSLWCLLLPFVVVAILALVGNSFDDSAQSGELVIAKIDTIIWLFGVTLLLLLSPLITLGMVRGEGMQAFGAKMGTMVTSAGMRTVSMLPLLAMMPDRVKSTISKATTGGRELKSRFGNSVKSAKEFGVSQAPSPTNPERNFGGKDSERTQNKNQRGAELNNKSSQASSTTQRGSGVQGQNGGGEKLREKESKATNGIRVATTQQSRPGNREKEFSKQSPGSSSRAVEQQNNHTHRQGQVKNTFSKKVEQSPRVIRRNNELR